MRKISVWVISGVQDFVALDADGQLRMGIVEDDIRDSEPSLFEIQGIDC